MHATQATHFEQRNSPPVTGRHAHHQRAVVLAQEAAHVYLFGELMGALMSDSRHAIDTPGFGPRRLTMPAFRAVSDGFAGHRGDATLVELLSLVAALAHGPTTTVHHMRAKALIAGVCKEHADMHAGDLAESLLGND